MSELSQGLLTREQQNAILQQKTIFLAGGPIDTTIVRDVVARSWRRSLEYGIDPQMCGQVHVGPEATRKALAVNTEMLDVAVQLIENMFSSMPEPLNSLSLADARGITLFTARKNVEERSLYPDSHVGASCAEHARGTNGVGTCIAEGVPVEIFGAEHYLAVAQCWSCASAPVFNGRGELCGVLNAGQMTSLYHKHTSGMVKALAFAISEQMKLKALLNRQQTIVELLEHGIIILSQSGVVEEINRGAAKIIGKSRHSCIGRPIEEIIKHNTLTENLLTIDVDVQDAEAKLTLASGKNIACVVSIFRQNLDGGLVLCLSENRRIRRLVMQMAGIKAVYTFDQILGTSSSIQQVIEQAKLVADKQTTVLLLGESGTGKELFAQAIHNASPRADRPFVTVNCGALPRSLVESELFGYEGGTFTGASKNGKPGKFELADGGTIFLDEIGEMPLDVQVALLRLLQSGEVTRVGGKTSTTVSVRVIAATNKNLEESMKQRSFRADLYYRLNVFPLCVPPLRARSGDVPCLATAFLDKISHNIDKPVNGFSSEVIRCFEAYSWPGNVRELENVVERMVNIAEVHRPVDVSCLPSHILRVEQVVAPKGRLMEKEIESISEVLVQCEGNMRAAAAVLGLSRGGLYGKLRRLGMDIEQFRNPRRGF